MEFGSWEINAFLFRVHGIKFQTASGFGFRHGKGLEGVYMPQLRSALTVVDRLNLKKSQLFFTKFVYEFHFQCRMPGIDQKVDYSTLN